MQENGETLKSLLKKYRKRERASIAFRKAMEETFPVGSLVWYRYLATGEELSGVVEEVGTDRNDFAIIVNGPSEKRCVHLLAVNRVDQKRVRGVQDDRGKIE